MHTFNLYKIKYLNLELLKNCTYMIHTYVYRAVYDRARAKRDGKMPL